MSNDLSTALKFFEENMSIFDNPQEQEKYNLYRGLVNLVGGIIDMQHEILNLKKETDKIYGHMRRITK